MSHSIIMYETIDCIGNISDHLPVLLEIPLDVSLILNRVKPHRDTGNIGTKPLWSHATEEDISLYKHCLDLHLKAIKLSTSLYCINIK